MHGVVSDTSVTRRRFIVVGEVGAGPGHGEMLSSQIRLGNGQTVNILL